MRSGTITTSCVDGQMLAGACTAVPATPAAQDTVCNNIDDDCDGEIDEDYVVTETSCGV